MHPLAPPHACARTELRTGTVPLLQRVRASGPCPAVWLLGSDPASCASPRGDTGPPARASLRPNTACRSPRRGAWRRRCLAPLGPSGCTPCESGALALDHRSGKIRLVVGSNCSLCLFGCGRHLPTPTRLLAGRAAEGSKLRTTALHRSPLSSMHHKSAAPAGCASARTRGKPWFSDAPLRPFLSRAAQAPRTEPARRYHTLLQLNSRSQPGFLEGAPSPAFRYRNAKKGGSAL